MLILVVLSLLVMFALMSMTYVLLASKQLSSAKSNARSQANAGSPQGELEAAFMQLARGGNPHSPINPHNLLADLNGDPQVRTVTNGTITTTIYGPNSVRGYLRQNGNPLVGGQLVDLVIGPHYIGTAEVDEFSKLEGYYEGCVLTMTSGAARGLSTRIVRYFNASDNGSPNDLKDDTATFRVVAFKGTNGTITPALNDTFLVNGRPFSGTGFGYNNESGKLDAMFNPDPTGNTLPVMPHALLINPAYYDSGPPNGYIPDSNDYASQGPGGLYPNGVPFGGVGGANEDYDAPDYQNLHLSLIDGTTNQVILPSFHRPDLIAYWHRELKAVLEAAPHSVPPDWDWDNPYDANGNGEAEGKTLLRKIMLRPSPLDHPNFTGSNPYLDINNVGWKIYFTGRNPSTGDFTSPWDVDNDSDGIMDSVWLDLGFPVRTTLDGRKYKPLFAILCVDLDGRININAHGSSIETITITLTPGPYAGSTSPSNPMLPRGCGNGPAEISLFATTSANGQSAGGFQSSELASLLFGNGNYQGRYGETIANNLTGAGWTETYSAINWGDTSASAAANNPGDPLARLKHFQYPDSRLRPTMGQLYRSNYGTPGDLWGRMDIAVDVRGQPLYWKPDWLGETVNSPYDINLSRDGSRLGSAGTSTGPDNPFTVFDLERLLRPWDIDTTALPSRLFGLMDNSVMSDPVQALRRARMLTTDSWDLPSPSVIAPRHFAPFHAHSIVELAGAALNAGGATNVNQHIRNILAPELIAGQRLNINRPFGDARDNNNNFVVDEPIQTEIENEGNALAKSAWSEVYNGSVRFNLIYGLDLDGDNDSDWFDQKHARSLLARHLYVLARLVMDNGFLDDSQWFTQSAALSIGQKRELTIRRIAQWAVNVVDFLDSDNICTPFEYDVNPWNGWDVDGVIDDGTGMVSDDDDHADRRIVWGSESQAAVITETFAMHDRRVADTALDGPAPAPGDDREGGDADLDQIRIPEGSLFVEIYATHNPNNPVYSGDLYHYDPTSKRWYLDLAAQYSDQPVWRLGISKPHVGGGAITDSPRDFTVTEWDSVSYEPRQGLLGAADTAVTGSLLPSGTALPTSAHVTSLHDVRLERIVWFVAPTVPPTNAMRDGRNIEIFYGRNYYNWYLPGTARVPAGGYAVVGPREKTYIGSEISTTQKFGTPSKHVIQFTDGMEDALSVEDTSSVLDYPNRLNIDAGPGQVKPAVGIVAASLAPATWADITLKNKGIGLNISEPLSEDNYYTEPTHTNAQQNNQRDAYGDLTGTGLKTFPDVPFDKVAGRPLAELTDGNQTKTTMNYRTVFLQRLANPFENYHPLQNPYISIDWMPVDLTVFNGEDRKPSTFDEAANGQWDPDDNNPDADIANRVAFASRQRGRYSQHTNSDYNIWSIWSDRTTTTATDPNFCLGGENPAFSTPSTTGSAQFKHVLHNKVMAGVTNSATLGFLNYSYGEPLTETQTSTLGTSVNLENDTYSAAYVGDPAKPFPWLVWNNRPFNNVAELMLVPATSAARLSTEFAVAKNTDNPYNNTGTPVDQRAHFNHLLNFFNSSKSAATLPTNSPNLVNFLEYVQVPSSFVGTEKMLSPAAFTWDGTGTPPAGTEWLYPPFNMISNYREPGRVNLNTIAVGAGSPSGSLSAAWNAVLGNDPAAGGAITSPTFDQLVESRRGYSAPATNPFRFDPDFPSVIANPFRTAPGAEMAPPLANLQHKPVNSTLWRAAGELANIDDPASNKPLFNFESTNQYNNTEQNPYFRYQTLGRLTSKVTTRSNVYAVWITVGYFEVEPHDPAVSGQPAGPNAIYPDGYWLGQELGADTGEINRHRAFYIFDRSIPVGYERGQDHNVQDAVLLRRFIE